MARWRTENFAFTASVNTLVPSETGAEAILLGINATSNNSTKLELIADRSAGQVVIHTEYLVAGIPVCIAPQPVPFARAGEEAAQILIKTNPTRPVAGVVYFDAEV